LATILKVADSLGMADVKQRVLLAMIGPFYGFLITLLTFFFVRPLWGTFPALICTLFMAVNSPSINYTMYGNIDAILKFQHNTSVKAKG